MLILIAGITGNIGQHAAAYALSQHHAVRGLSRTPTKLAPDIHSALESFIQISSYDDVSTLDRACSGVDAVICTYAGLPTLHLDAQLLLLRAAERANIARFLAAGWNYDWRNVPWGQDAPIYDPIRSFHAQAEIDSSIKPCHIFSGMLAEVFFGVDNQNGFTPSVGGVWQGPASASASTSISTSTSTTVEYHDDNRPKPRTSPSMDVYGTGTTPWNFTTERDAAKWGVQLITSPKAEQGGFYSLCSFSLSLTQIREIYERVRGVPVNVTHRGSVDDLERLAITQRDAHGRRKLWEWHRHFFHLNCVKGEWNLRDIENDKFPEVKATSFEEFLAEFPNV